MPWKFRLTRMEYEQLSDDLRDGKISDITQAQRRELREITRLGDSYPYRETKR